VFGLVPLLAKLPGLDVVLLQPGAPQLVLTVLALGAMAVRGKRVVGVEAAEAGLTAGRGLGRLGQRRLSPWTIIVAIALLLVPWVVSFAALGTALLAIQLALVALSLVVLIGWVGQISLGQAAFVGVGALVSAMVARAGIGFVHENGATPRRYLIEAMGGGVAVIDCDGDGRQDLYFVDSGEVPASTDQQRPGSSRLYRNLGGWRFEDVTARAGVAGRGYGQGAVVGDVHTNDLAGKGSAASVGTVVPFSAAVMPALPVPGPVSPGTQAVGVKNATTVTLAAGAYAGGDVKAKGKLVLSGGVYHFSSLSFGQGSRLEALAPVEVRIAGRLDAGQSEYVGPAVGSGLGARHVRVEVNGTNGGNGDANAGPKAAVFGQASQVRALVLVPNAGHAITLEQSAAVFRKKLSSWLEKRGL
jgi:hypothetical protein